MADVARVARKFRVAIQKLATAVEVYNRRLTVDELLQISASTTPSEIGSWQCLGLFDWHVVPELWYLIALLFAWQSLWVDFCLNTSCGLHPDTPSSGYFSQLQATMAMIRPFQTINNTTLWKQLEPALPDGFFGTLAILEATGGISCSTWHWLQITMACRAMELTFLPDLDMPPTWSVSTTRGKCVCCNRAPPPGTDCSSFAIFNFYFTIHQYSFH